METSVIHSPKELAVYAQHLVNELAQEMQDEAYVLALTGDLGAGKTALTKAIAEELGVSDMVQSPTFVIQKTYPLSEEAPFKNLVHIDAYRLENADELSALGFEETVNTSDNLIIVEWAERIAEQIPESALWLSLELLPDGSRRVIPKKDHEHTQ